jgi:putative tryptophan/tyrosine transport system substrate-binding protein
MLRLDRRADMRRREFIVVLGGAAAAWPLATRAQQAERVRHVGVLMAASADDPEYQARMAAFQQGLEQLGWTEGRNVRIDIRWATTDTDQIRKHAGELAALAPDVILAATGTCVYQKLKLGRSGDEVRLGWQVT